MSLAQDGVSFVIDAKNIRPYDNCGVEILRLTQIPAHHNYTVQDIMQSKLAIKTGFMRLSRDNLA